MEGLELAAFEIISSAGMARSLYIEAIDCADNNDFENAQGKIDEASAYFIKAHQVHMNLLSDEANLKEMQNSLLLTHAEDQLMSAETLSILAEKIIRIYKRLLDMKN